MEKKLFNTLDNSEQKGLSELIKKPKPGMMVIIILAALFLIYFFYKFVFSGIMSAEDVKNSLEIVWHQSRWVQKSATPYEVTIVPALLIKIKNTGNAPLRYLDIEGIFEMIGPGDFQSDGYVRALANPLLPGETSDAIDIRASHGYRATSREAFKQNIDKWKQMKAKIFIRTKGSPLVRIGDSYMISQEIEGEDPSADQSSENEVKLDDRAELLGKSIAIVWNESKWIDKDVRSKIVTIVPSIRIKVQNNGDTELKNIYFKGEFEFVDSGQLLSEVAALELQNGLPIDTLSSEILIKSDWGYNADSKADFIKRKSDWRQVQVKLYAKEKDAPQYVLLGTYPISQVIEGVRVVYQ